LIFWVAAIFLLPVSPIWPPRRPFLPYGRPNLALLGFLYWYMFSFLRLLYMLIFLRFPVFCRPPQINLRKACHKGPIGYKQWRRLRGERPLQKIRWGTEALYFVTLRGAVIISRRGAVFRDAVCAVRAVRYFVTRPVSAPVRAVCAVRCFVTPVVYHLLSVTCSNNNSILYLSETLSMICQNLKSRDRDDLQRFPGQALSRRRRFPDNEVIHLYVTACIGQAVSDLKSTT